MKSTSSVLFVLFLLSFHSLSATYAQKPLAPSIFIFGDSLSDDGNNNGLPTAARANYPPYGIDFINGATGRFTNGNNVVDYIAEFLGLPYPPPYLGLSPDKRSKIITGVNYASAAAGILPETGTRMGRNIQLSEQVNNFQKTVQQDLPQNFKYHKEVLDYLSKSIFIVYIGMNDYGNNYLRPDFYNTSKQYNPLQFADLLVQRLSQQLKRLYDLGARKIVVFESLPLGCMPAATNVIDFFPICIEPVNQMVLPFNFNLLPMLRRMTEDLPGSIFVDGQVYALAYDAYQNPSKYGFRYTNIPCCIVSNHGTSQCIPRRPPCQDRDQHLFWDAFHPTQAANVLLALACFNQSNSVCSPMNIQQLAQVKLGY